MKSPRDINKTKWLKKSAALDVIFVHHEECNTGSVTVSLPFKRQTIPQQLATSTNVFNFLCHLYALSALFNDALTPHT